jgi:hypothetical protein
MCKNYKHLNRSVPVNNQLDAHFFFRIYSNSLHVSSPPVLIIRRINCINPLKAELNPVCYLLVLLGDLTFMGPCIVSIFQYISNKMQRLHSLFISGNFSICFGWYFHPSSGAHTTVSTASGICHTVTICRYRGRVENVGRNLDL